MREDADRQPADPRHRGALELARIELPTRELGGSEELNHGGKLFALRGVQGPPARVHLREKRLRPPGRGGARFKSRS